MLKIILKLPVHANAFLGNPTVSDCDSWLRINMTSPLLEHRARARRDGTVPIHAPIPLLIPVKPEECMSDQSQTALVPPPSNGKVVKW